MFIHVHDKVIEIQPDGDDNWIVNSGKPASTNDAGLAFFLQHHSAPPDPTARYRCVRDYPWQCPWLREGGAEPCTSKYKAARKDLAMLQGSNYERKPYTRPQKDKNGQLALFDTEEYWLNTKTGKTRILQTPLETRPYVTYDVVCRQFAVASMEWLKRKHDYTPLKWRILPADNDMWWMSQMQVKHSGKYKACVFDTWE